MPKKKKPIMGFDTETTLFSDHNKFTTLVAGAVDHEDVRVRPVGRAEILKCFATWSRENIITTANGVYDLVVIAREAEREGRFGMLDAIFDCLEQGNYFDIQISQALDAIANGHHLRKPSGQPLKTKRYSLASCAELTLGESKGDDWWRMRYGHLRGVPFDEWPIDAMEYLLKDATLPKDIAMVHLGRTGGRRYRNLKDMKLQTRAHFAMYLAGVWGIRTDKDAIDKVEAKASKRLKELQGKYQDKGFFKWDKKDQKQKVDGLLLKKELCRAYGVVGVCPVCKGTGKIPSSAKGAIGKDGQVKKWKNCIAGYNEKDGRNKIPIATGGCDGTGLDLNSSAVLPRAETFGVKKDRVSILESGDDELYEFGQVSEVEKILQTYIPFLRSGQDGPITLEPNVLLKSGRASYDGLIQLLPRGWNIRDCFKARPGYVLCSIDYDGLELAALAQQCLDILGHSEMAKAINTGMDLHSLTGSNLIGIDYEKFFGLRKEGDKKIKTIRQAAKEPNFGFPGKMGAATLVANARLESKGKTIAPDGREYPGVRFCIILGGAKRCGVQKVTEWSRRPCEPICAHCVEIAERELKPTWFKTYPEMHDYFKYVKGELDAKGELTVGDLTRGDLNICSGSNFLFQSRAARGAKEALWRVSKECYTDKSSAMYGARPIVFAHDEIVSELPEAYAHDAAHRMAEAMRDAMSEELPDMLIGAQPAIMRQWYKDAEPVYDENERLVPWEPSM